jgi:hypothetical protein
MGKSPGELWGDLIRRHCRQLAANSASTVSCLIGLENFPNVYVWPGSGGKTITFGHPNTKFDCGPGFADAKALNYLGCTLCAKFAEFAEFCPTSAPGDLAI